MKESVGWTSLRLTIRLLNLKRPQLNRAVQVLTRALQSTAAQENYRSCLSLLSVQNVA